MPVQREHVNAPELVRSDTASQTEDQHDAQHDQTRGHVKRVQTNQRVVGRSEKIG